MRATHRFRTDRRAATAVEFALVTPIMLALIFGLLELSFQAFVQATLNGAVISAGRSASLEGNANDQAAVDNFVRAQVKSIAGQASLNFDRSNYYAVADIGQPEVFTDRNGNGQREAGECYTDYNRNGRWDADRGRGGQGGSNDFTRYRVTVTYPRFLPMRLLGMPQTATLTALSVLRNQPYAGQAGVGTTQICT